MSAYFARTSGAAGGDCLGGHVSAITCQDIQAVNTVDSIQCLEVTAAYGVSRVRYAIDKNGNDFNLILTAYIPLAGWGTVDLSTYEIAVGEEYTWDLSGYINYGYITVKRHFAGAATGRLIGYFADTYQTPWMRPDLPVTNTDYYYSCVALVLTADTYVHSIIGGSVTHYFPGTAATYATPIADHTTEPGGAVWTDSTVVDATLTAGTYYVWLKVGQDIGDVTVKFAPAGDYISLQVRPRTYDVSKKRYRLYGAYDGSTCGGSLLAESNTLPVAYTLTPPGSGTRTYRMRLVEQTYYGVESQNQLLDQKIVISAVGADVTVPPAPDSVAVTALDGGRAQVTATITQPATGSRIIFVVFDVDGTETYVEVHPNQTEYSVITDPVTWGSTISATAKNIDANLRESATTSGSATIYYDMDAQPENVTARIGWYSVVRQPADLFVSNVDGDLVLFGEWWGTDITYAGARVATITDTISLAPGWIIVNGSVSGASAKTWEDAGSGIFYMGDGTNRRIKFDTNTTTITVPDIQQLIDDPCPLSDAVKQHGAYTRFQAAYQKYFTWCMFDATKTYMIEITQEES